MTTPTITRTQLSGWANYPKVAAEIASGIDTATVRAYILAQERVIARGAGKSYGDAAIGKRVISMLSMSRILEFDAEKGELECESGALLADLLPTIVPAGWFFHVTPGIKNITVGGAIASDVHGKNHPQKGCFSNWLIHFDLMTEQGDIVRCSKNENASLFWQTCGGMGWTGVILSARFQLMQVRSTLMRQQTVRCSNIDEIFDAFEAHADSPYAAGWIDTTASGDKFGRGAVHFAAHIDSPGQPLVYHEKEARNIAFYAPNWLLNRVSIRIHNWMYFRKNPSAQREVPMDAYFYPLDSLRNWNRLYGRRGLIQYQCCIPDENAREGIQKVMKMVQVSGETPFLSVLKRHGERPPEAVCSFPIKGYSLALDFPRTRNIFSLVQRLDDLVWNLGGKIYLTKDACSHPRMGRISLAAFNTGKFSSALRERIS